MATLEQDCPSSAQALIESGSSAIAGMLIATIAALVLTFLGWLAWAEVEEVVHAAGRVEPIGRSKIVNHPHGGRTAEILVRDGDQVAAGQPLLTLDTEVAKSEQAELLGRWQALAVEVARLEAEQAGSPAAFEPTLAAARPDLVGAAQTLLAARRESQESRREGAEKQAQTRRGDLNTAAAEMGRLRNRLVLMRQERDAVRELAARGLYPQLKLIAVERQTADSEGELAKAEAAAAAARSALAESESRLASVEHDWRSNVLGELAQATAERDRLGEQLRAQTTLIANAVLRAPVPGIVQDLAIAGPGQSVAAYETLMRIVPLGEGLSVEARVANEDIGRLRVGMPAEIKVRAFDYLRFGKIDGSVRRVAADATPDPASGTLAYTVTVAADRYRLGVNPGQLEMVPGMVVDVDLKVGERTILSYLTDRILSFREAFRET